MHTGRCRGWLAVVWACLCCCGGVRGEAGPACPPAVGPRCVADGGSHDEFNYKVDGNDVNILFKDGGYFTMTCPENVTLDSPALPRFTEEVRVNKVRLSDCPSPEHSYAHVLRVLNVLALDTVTIEQAKQEINSTHLSGLDVGSLALERLSIAPDAFDAFNGTTHLVHLRFTSVRQVHVERLPTSLQYLKLEFTDVRRVSRDHLERLPALTKLVMRDNGNISVEVSGSLQELALEADSVRVLDHALPDRLAKLTLKGWAERTPQPWNTCKMLKELLVVEAIITLPNEWLANCKELRELTLKECTVKKLPKGLLDNAKSLSVFDLSGNLLQDLPSGLFANTKRITVVDLSNNDLTNDAFGALGEPSLQELRLADNPRLGDACAADKGGGLVRGLSLLKDLTRLRKLVLARTGATVVCRDFRENMPLLQELDLSDNNIVELGLPDLQFRANTRVDLRGNNVTRLAYDWNEYELLVDNRERYCEENAPDASRASFEIDAALRCDCLMLPAARALRDCPAHVRLVPPPRCDSRRALADVPLDDLACALPAADCAAPPPCACAWRDTGARARGPVLRVACPGAGLARAPLAPAAADLLLPGNNIAALARADLPPHLHTLDLRNNSLRRLDPSIVAALPADGRLWLGGNDLSCDCEDADAVAALLGRSDRVQDFEELRCPGGGPLRPPTCERLGPLSTLAAALVPLLAVAALLLGCLARRESRARLKMALRRLGWLPPPAEPDDDGRPYDAFVSFSHLDEDVVRELLAQLEGGARPYRVCVHYRDWAPGGWIPAQIAASVRRSRRTLAVVSERFLASTWARAEFREAHAAALRDPEQRLVVVLLDEPARLPLDDELRRYLAANTYVRWGDPWFWPKLRAALPPPRGRAAPPPAPADPPDSAHPGGPAHPADPAHPGGPAHPAHPSGPAHPADPAHPGGPAPLMLQLLSGAAA